jgi:hypothetical protein
MSEIRDILKVRGTTHGDYSDHARITQNIKSVMHDSPNWNVLSADQVETLDMIAHKIGRILAGNPDFRDHWDDIAGYATLSADRVNGEKK